MATRRLAIVAVTPPNWTPADQDPMQWAAAMADDLLDTLALLAEVDAAVAIAADNPDAGLLAGQVGWPGLASYPLPALDLETIFGAAAADGYDQAVIIAADAPDLPGLVIAKLLRPLTTRGVAVAPVEPRGSAVHPTGLLGVAVRLPAPNWLPAGCLDDLSVPQMRASAPSAVDLAVTAGWHRLRTEADLAWLDSRLEGWDATRALLAP